MFKAGDVVVCVDSSHSYGYLRCDAEYVISEVLPGDLKLEGFHTGGWMKSRFELKEKEEEMPEIKGQSIDWQVGQEVFCLLRGKGVVDKYDVNDQYYPVEVHFPEKEETNYYTKEGADEDGYNRSLFFSEPQVIAERFPPKKPFVAVLKEGDTIMGQNKDIGGLFSIIVKEENEFSVISSNNTVFSKDFFIFYKAEPIEFN